MNKNKEKRERPFTTEQIINAMVALGGYNGQNTEIEHQAEAKRLGGKDIYRIFLANALLGMVETNAMLTDGEGVLQDRMLEAHHQSLVSAGAVDDASKLIGFLRWRTLRVSGKLREMSQNPEFGPLPLASAHAAHGLQNLLGVCEAGQNPLQASPTDMKRGILEAKESLKLAIANIDIMLKLISQIENMGKG